MQKIIIFFLLLINFSHADSLFDAAYGLWGVGAVSRDRNYRGVDIDVTPGIFIFGGCFSKIRAVFKSASFSGSSRSRDVKTFHCLHFWQNNFTTK